MKEAIKAALRPIAATLRDGAWAFLAVGAALAIVSLVWLAVAQARKASPARTGPVFGGAAPAGRWAWALVISMMMVGAAVRFDGIGDDSISHPEAYTPGLPLAEGISKPPPTHSLGGMLVQYYNLEPHPLGFYAAIYAWGQAFGTDMASLRWLEALLGIACIPLIFRVGALAYGPSVGLASAALLTLHGLHVQWSQIARMYVPATFVGLVSVWLLFELRAARRTPGWLQAAYVASLCAGLTTEWFFWLILAAQMLFCLVHYAPNARSPRLYYLQTVALLLSSYELSHVFNSMPYVGSGQIAKLADLRDYLGFGFLFGTDEFSDPIREPALPLVLASFGLGLVGLIRGVGGVEQIDDRPETGPSLGRGPVRLLGLAMLLFLVGLALHASNEFVHRVEYMVIPVCGIPLFAMFLPELGDRLGPSLSRLGQRLPAGLGASRLGVVLLLAVVPATLVFAVSPVKPMVARRAMLMLVPYLLIVTAEGLRALCRPRWSQWAVGAVIAVLLVTSTIFHRAIPTSPRDYKQVAHDITSRLHPTDLIFVTKGDWAMTPVFYYLPHAPLVAERYAEALSDDADRRVWVIVFDNTDTAPMEAALEPSHRLAQTFETLRGKARLYEPIR